LRNACFIWMNWCVMTSRMDTGLLFCITTRYPIPDTRNPWCRVSGVGWWMMDASREWLVAWLVGVGCQHRTKFEIRGWMIGVYLSK
jgi:hypothetical protein